MRYVPNDGSIEENAVQNRFTAYLKVSLEHNKIRFSCKKKQQNNAEISYLDTDEIITEASAYDPFANLFSAEIGDAKLQHAIDLLRKQERLILTMHVLQEISLKLIADELSIPYPTVKSLYRRSLEKLRKELKKNEF